MNANIEVIEKLSFESQDELRHTRRVFLKGIFKAAGVSTPTTFIVLNEVLPPKPPEEDVNKILNMVAAADGSGVGFQTKQASSTLSADGADIILEGDLKEGYDLGMKWVKRIESVAAKVAAGEVGEVAFEIINEGIKDLIVGNEMYLYLIDELTGEPVRAKGWPIVIKKPTEVVPKLLPLMQVGMRAMSIFNGAAGVARMFGYPVPIVPKAWSEGAQESVELLKQESSVEQFGVVHTEDKKGNEEKKSVRGVSLREFMDFIRKNDPGLKDGKSGDFSGLQRIVDPEDGTALWTMLIDTVDIENALKERAKQRKEEQLKHDEHIQKLEVWQRAVGDDPDDDFTDARDKPCMNWIRYLFGWNCQSTIWNRTNSVVYVIIKDTKTKKITNTNRNVEVKPTFNPFSCCQAAIASTASEEEEEVQTLTISPIPSMQNQTFNLNGSDYFLTFYTVTAESERIVHQLNIRVKGKHDYVIKQQYLENRVEVSERDYTLGVAIFGPDWRPTPPTG